MRRSSPKFGDLTGSFGPLAYPCAGLPDGVTVAQQTLDLFVMVQIHVGQPESLPRLVTDLEVHAKERWRLISALGQDLVRLLVGHAFVKAVVAHHHGRR